MRGFWEYIKSLYPTQLPVGMTEFQEWSNSILKLSKVPDNDSTRFAIAVMILHLNANEDRKPKRYFVKCLNKSAANECGNAIAMILKEKQKQAAQVEAQRLAEAQNIGSNNNGASNEVERNKEI